MKTKKQTNQVEAKPTQTSPQPTYQVIGLLLEDGRTVFAYTEKFCNSMDEIMVKGITILEMEEFLKLARAPLGEE